MYFSHSKHWKELEQPEERESGKFRLRLQIVDSPDVPDVSSDAECNVDSNEDKPDYNCHELHCLMEQHFPLKAHTIASEGLVEFKIEDGKDKFSACSCCFICPHQGRKCAREVEQLSLLFLCCFCPPLPNMVPMCLREMLKCLSTECLLEFLLAY